MRRSAANKMVLGLFVMIALALFIGAIYYMGKQRKLFGESVKVSARFSHVGGLMVGNNVRFAGINVGTVDNIIILNDSTVEVSMILEKNVKKFIRKDSRAVIGAEGLMGNKLINILPGTTGAPTIERDDILLTSKSVDLDDIMQNLEKTSQNAVIISQELADFTQKVNNSNGALSRFLYDSTFAETIARSMKNVEKGTQGFEENMNAVKDNFLFRGYYRKKERQKLEEQRAEESAKKLKAGKGTPISKDKDEDDDDDDDDKKDASPKKNRLKFWK